MNTWGTTLLATGSLCLGLMTAGVLATEVNTRTLNNGQLVLEDVPAIPQSLVDALNRYQNTRRAPFRAWSKAGDSLFVTTRFGDVNQVHRVDQPGGARHQLSFLAEPVGEIALRPGSDTLTYTMDAGGSEYSQIFVLDTRSGESTMLTDGKSRNDSLLWSPDGAKLAFRSTRRNEVSNDIWVMPAGKPEAAKLLVEAKSGAWWAPGAWDDEGKLLLAQQYVSTVDARIMLVDTSTGQQRVLEGGDAARSYNAPLAFSADNAGYFFTTNQFSEFKQLAYRKLAGGETRVISRDIPWDVDGFAISEDRRRAAFSVNAGGLSRLYLLDSNSMKLKQVEGLPVGLLSGMEFDPQGQRLAMTLNTAQTPSDSFVLDLGRRALNAGELTRWTFSETGGLDASRFVSPELVHFKSFDDRSIPAFIYRPPANNTRRPVIITIHGGPEGQWRPRFASTYQLWMDKLGAAVIAPNVRGSAGYGKEYLNLDNAYQREDSVQDIGALLDWIATQPDLDPNRVAVFGGSYGGYMVLASAVHYSDRLKAAVDIVGISNFVTFLENTKAYRQDVRRVEYGDERDPAMRAHLEKISPINAVDKITVPMLVVQGQNDPRVPVSEAIQIVDALRAKNKPVWYMNALNEGHGYRRKENRDVYAQVVVMFLQQYL